MKIFSIPQSSQNITSNNFFQEIRLWKESGIVHIIYLLRSGLDQASRIRTMSGIKINFISAVTNGQNSETSDPSSEVVLSSASASGWSDCPNV